MQLIFSDLRRRCAVRVLSDCGAVDFGCEFTAGLAVCPDAFDAVVAVELSDELAFEGV